MCSKMFFERDALRKHMLNIHTSKTGLESEKIDTIFFWKFWTNGYFYVFFFFAEFECTHCSKAYKHRGDLNKHLRVHLGEKLYKCLKCPEAFRLPWQLEKHSFIHYEETSVDDGTAKTALSSKKANKRDSFWAIQMLSCTHSIAWIKPNKIIKVNWS